MATIIERACSATQYRSSLAARDVNRTQTAGAAFPSGSCAFPIPSGLPAGGYELRLYTSSWALLASTTLTLTAASSGATINVAPGSGVAAGGTVTVSWSALPSPAPTDRIGLYAPGGQSWLDWMYLSCSKTAGSTSASGSCAFTLPATLANGSYEMRLLKSTGAAASFTDRGFTGHEHVKTAGDGIIHMNGRVYDANLGRFLSPDPNITAPEVTQDFNRYSYVLNNPLSLTDPTGYSWLSKAFRKIKKYIKPIVAAVIGFYTFGAVSSWIYNAWATSAATAAAAAGQTLAYAQVAGMYSTSLAAGGAAGGFVSGGIATGSLDGALKGAVTGGVGAGIGGALAAADYATLGRMVGSGVNGYLQTGGSEGFLRGFASGVIPNDLGFTNAYMNNGAANLGIGIVRDGIRGSIVDGSSSGFLRGVRYGQFNNAIGHLVGFASTLSLPKFGEGAFVYRGGAWNWTGGAITFGNVVSGPRDIMSTMTYSHERDHIFNPVEQSLGVTYIGVHGLDLAVGNLGSLLGQGCSWHFMEEGVQKYPYSLGFGSCAR